MYLEIQKPKSKQEENTAANVVNEGEVLSLRSLIQIISRKALRSADLY